MEGHGLLADGVVIHLGRDELDGVGSVVGLPLGGGLDCVEALEKGLHRGGELRDKGGSLV